MKLSGRFPQSFLWIAIGAILAALLVTSVMTQHDGALSAKRPAGHAAQAAS